jgi:hypothetical protein
VPKRKQGQRPEWSGKPVTERQMLRWVREYERRYFNGKRLAIAVTIQPRLADYASYGLFSIIDISDEVIRSHKLVRILLLHELVHGKLFLETNNTEVKHGPRFQAEVKRLMAQGAYDTLL